VPLLVFVSATGNPDDGGTFERRSSFTGRSVANKPEEVPVVPRIAERPNHPSGRSVMR
jgi:hypothetical protein